MQTSIKMPRLDGQKWVYAALEVRDGDRVLKPTHVGFDRIRFSEPPKLRNSQVEITITNGDEEQKNVADVLPHDSDAIMIPIRLVTE